MFDFSQDRKYLDTISQQYYEVISELGAYLAQEQSPQEKSKAISPGWSKVGESPEAVFSLLDSIGGLASQVKIDLKNIQPLVRDLFHSEWYASQFKTAPKEIDLFKHYLSFGWNAGLSPHPVFDPAFYISTNHLKKLSIDPFAHFLAIGGSFGLSPHSYFDSTWYLKKYPDVAEDGRNPLVHYLKYGFKEGRDPSLSFSTNVYLDMYCDIKSSGVNPLVHYLQYGIYEKRTIKESQFALNL